jgi:hypothetical protein
MAFDRQRYEKEVIGPLRGRHGRLPDDDLPRRYAVDASMRTEDLRNHLRELRRYWNSKAGGADSKARVCRQFLAADEELQRSAGAEMYDPQWWARQAKRRDDAQREAVEQLAADLARAYGGTGLVTRAQLERIVQHYADLPPQAVDRAARQARMRVVDAVQLPTESGLDRTAYRGLLQRMGEVGAGTIVHLVHPDLNRPFTLVREFEVEGEGRPRLRLDRAAVEARIAAMERAADSPVVRARKAALRVLDTGLRAGADLRVIALYQVIERLVTHRAGGLADALLVRQATRLGLTQADAELLVVSLPTDVEPVSSAATQIRELLSDGQLRAAQQALSALPATDPEHADLEQAVRRQLDEVRRLLAGVDTALRERKEEEAERLLRDAHRIAADDGDVETWLRRLPPPPPREPAAVEAAAEVRLSWQPSLSAAEVRYRVVRVEGRAPRSPDDGVQVAETDGTAVVDRSPPVARNLHYAIFAAPAGGTVWSRPATVTAEVVPAVTDARLRVSPEEITGTWTVHPSVLAVRVCRTRSRPPRAPEDGYAVRATTASFVDRDVAEGEQYFYGLTAVYRDARGTEVTAPMSVVSARPRAAAKPVQELTVAPLAVTGDTARVRLSWPADAGDVRIRCATRLPGWDVGDLVSMADLDRFGREVAGTPVVDGDRAVLEADVPAGPQVYVPFALGGNGAVVGRPVEMGHANPVRQLHARRIGEQVVVTWVWPDQVTLAEVEWSTPQLPRQVRRVTHAQYVDGSGCRLPVGAGGGTVVVRTVTVGPTGESVSTPAELTVDGRPVQVTYSLRRPSELRARWSRRRVLTLTADGDCAALDLVVIVAAGLVLPLRAEQGTVVDRFEGLRLSRDTPRTLDVELPRGLRTPYWIRCFATGPGVTLVDPPIAELKVT